MIAYPLLLFPDPTKFGKCKNSNFFLIHTEWCRNTYMTGRWANPQVKIFDFFLRHFCINIIQLNNCCLSFLFNSHRTTFFKGKESSLMLSNTASSHAGLTENFLNCIAGHICYPVHYCVLAN